jgi:hypothetical protein
MKIELVLILVFAMATTAQAKDPRGYEKGVLVQMESSSCGYSETDGKTIAGRIFGIDAGSR